MIEDVRDWVGDEPDDAAVQAALDRFDGQTHQVERAARSILRRREASMGADSTSFAVAGDYSETSTGGGLRTSLLRTLARLDALIGDGVSTLPELTAAKLCGPGNLR